MCMTGCVYVKTHVPSVWVQYLCVYLTQHPTELRVRKTIVVNALVLCRLSCEVGGDGGNHLTTKGTDNRVGGWRNGHHEQNLFYVGIKHRPTHEHAAQHGCSRQQMNVVPLHYCVCVASHTWISGRSLWISWSFICVISKPWQTCWH